MPAAHLIEESIERFWREEAVFASDAAMILECLRCTPRGSDGWGQPSLPSVVESKSRGLRVVGLASGSKERAKIDDGRDGTPCRPDRLEVSRLPKNKCAYLEARTPFERTRSNMLLHALRTNARPPANGRYSRPPPRRRAIPTVRGGKQVQRLRMRNFVPSAL